MGICYEEMCYRDMLWNIPYFHRTMFVISTHLDRLIDTILINILDIPFIFIEDRNNIIYLSPFACWPGNVINPQWLELPLSRTFHGPKDV